MSKLVNLYYFIRKNEFYVILLISFFLFSSFSDNEKTLNTKIKTIVIDPGHGGKDPGTMGTKRFNIYEKHIALDVSLKLGKLIKDKYPEINIIYTRKEDFFLELYERTEIANKSKADLFISIHCDGYTNPEPYGASVFVMGMSKLKQNMDVAIRENSVMYLEDNYKEKYNGFDPKSPESYIVFTLMQNSYLNHSVKIAEEVEKEFAIQAKRKSRGVKQAPFYVISRVNMPSILVECGFLTNPKEEEYLHTEEGQNAIARSIFNGFNAYKKHIDGDNKIIGSNLKKKIDVNKNEANLTKKDKVIFKVQIATNTKSIKNDGIFTRLNVEEKFINDVFKYYIGNFEDKQKADKLRIDMLNKGFKGSFVVPFYNEKRISMKDALNLQNKTKTYE